MKIRATTILTVLAASSMSISSALASEEGGARFKFPPHYYRMEGASVPSELQAAPSAVRSMHSGSVPHGSNFLGLEPKMLAAPAVSPSVQTAVSAQPRLATPQMPVATPYRAEYGKLPAPQALAALPKSAAPIALPKGLPVKSGTRSQAHRAVTGKVLKPKSAVGSSAGPMMALSKGIDSYGNHFGYEPGAYLPTNSGAGTRTSTDVTGKLVQIH